MDWELMEPGRPKSSYRSQHVINHILHKKVREDNLLHVMGAVTNPARYQSRYRLARHWIRVMSRTANIKLHVVEGAFGDRKPELEEFCQHLGVSYLCVRIKSEAWIKENLLNICEKQLVPRWARYLAWIDCDVFFRNPEWAQETIQQLQHYPIVQPWQSAVNLGPTGNVSKAFDSVGHMIHKGIDPVRGKKYNGDPYIFGHTGYAWACTRAFWENVQGLIDFAILGSADHHMALGCRGMYSHSVHSMMGGTFKELIHAWQTRAMQVTHGVVGFVNGRIEHEFHGPMSRREYVKRWEILIKHNFCPVNDLRRDDQGVIQLVGKPGLEHDIRTYNRRRLEDSIEEY
jgi:hypothetical protein